MTGIETEAETLLTAMADAEEDTLDLLEGALALAVFDAPSASLDAYRTHAERLAKDVADILDKNEGATAPVDCLAALRHVFHGLHGYSGDADSYDDLQNANMIRVIDRRRGLPVALGILYIHIARTQGWEAAGLDFPGHFLISIAIEGERFIVDPFHEGTTLEAAELRAMLKATIGQDAELDPTHYRPVPDIKVLLRLQNNIKQRLIQDQQLERAAGIVDTMLLLAPDLAYLWRESGLLNAHIGKVRTAISALETYVDRETRDEPRQEAVKLVADLKQRLN